MSCSSADQHTKCRNLYALCLAPDTELQTAADSRTGSRSRTGSGCQLSQNGHKTFTIYHALLRTILATFGACVERAQQGQSLPVSLSLSIWHFPNSLSLPLPCLVATFCETRNLHMYPTTTTRRRGATWCVYLAKLTERLHCKLNSALLCLSAMCA